MTQTKMDYIDVVLCVEQTKITAQFGRSRSREITLQGVSKTNRKRAFGKALSALYSGRRISGRQ